MTDEPITPERVRALLADNLPGPGVMRFIDAAPSIARAYLESAAEVERLRAALHEALDGWDAERDEGRVIEVPDPIGGGAWRPSSPERAPSIEERAK